MERLYAEVDKLTTELEWIEKIWSQLGVSRNDNPWSS